VKVLYVGPRKVWKHWQGAIVNLGKDYMHLVGKKVMLKVVVLESEEKQGESRTGLVSPSESVDSEAPSYTSSAKNPLTKVKYK